MIMREANLKIEQMNAKNEADERYVNADKEMYSIRQFNPATREWT